MPDKITQDGYCFSQTQKLVEEGDTEAARKEFNLLYISVDMEWSCYHTANCGNSRCGSWMSNGVLVNNITKVSILGHIYYYFLPLFIDILLS